MQPLHQDRHSVPAMDLKPSDLGCLNWRVRKGDFYTLPKINVSKKQTWGFGYVESTGWFGDTASGRGHVIPTECTALNCSFDMTMKQPKLEEKSWFRIRHLFHQMIWECFFLRCICTLPMVSTNSPPKKDRCQKKNQLPKSGFWNLEEVRLVRQALWTKHTLPETNVAPENRPLEKEIPIGNHHFQVLC